MIGEGEIFLKKETQERQGTMFIVFFCKFFLIYIVTGLQVFVWTSSTTWERKYRGNTL